jgi:acetyl-CoA carboxylase biotin carboxylase subunit
MGETAKKVIQVSGYNNAGTVEFLLDKNKNFYFLEVNARLQVEHPVTEFITGIDLVHQQIKIASGDQLTLKQEELVQKGHAIECRIYAEDPFNNFLPSAGKVFFLKEPSGPGVRHDCGIYSGCDVPIFYDPILAKLIVWAENRQMSQRRMISALDDYVILGIQTTIGFLKDVIAHPQFQSGETTTSFIDRYFSRWGGKEKAEEARTIAALAAAFDSQSRISAVQVTAGQSIAPSPWKTLGKWRLGGGS